MVDDVALVFPGGKEIEELLVKRLGAIAFLGHGRLPDSSEIHDILTQLPPPAQAMV